MRELGRDNITAVNAVMVPAPDPISFSSEEIEAFGKVRSTLLNEGKVPADAVKMREVALVTIMSKCRVDKAVAKYNDLVSTLKVHSLTMDCLYPSAEELDKMADRLNENYQVCGVDKGGRGIMWLSSSKPIQVDEEADAVRSGMLYWLAVHSDIHTLREGCTFVIDTSKQTGKKVGNEKKMQQTWQSLPLRPQHLFIVGASWGKRVFINAMIRFASVFSSSKILGRVRFVEIDSVRDEIPEASMPHYLDGEKRSSVSEWVRTRITAFDGLTDEWQRQ